jgi:predicted P-loop ATPase
MSKLTPSSRKNPCPICNRIKDGDCRTDENGMVLCHTFIDSDANVPAYIYRGAAKSGDWGKYFHKSEQPSTPWIKPARTQNQQEYIYTNSAHQFVAKVTRTDKGTGEKSFYQSHWNGSRWIKGQMDTVKANIHLYQIFSLTNEKALANGEPLLLVEGEGKVDALLERGIAATCAIGGSGKWRLYGYPNYLEDLKGANLVLCPDRDRKGMDHCLDIAQDFPEAKWVYCEPQSPEWEQLPPKAGYDIKDWIVDGANNQTILGAIGDKRQEQAKSPEPKQNNNVDELCKLARQFQQVQQKLGHRLRLNTLTKEIELDGQALNPDRVALNLANDFNLQISKCNALDIVTELAERNSYNPIVEYLTRVRQKHGDSTGILRNLSSRYFGTNNPLYDTYVRKTLIGAVARVMQPGCKMDTALILQGKQNAGKSTFFNILAGKDWFDDSLGNTSDKDEKLKLHMTWFMEWAELENVFKRRDIANVKAFLSSATDTIRPPYGRLPQRCDRHSVIVGTTNEHEFLADATGSRRFWVIPVRQDIDLEMLRRERDLIWAAAVTLYEQGEIWYLLREEEALREDLNAEYQTTDPWQDDIENYLSHREVVSIREICEDLLKIEVSQQNSSTQIRISKIMTQIGWESPKNARQHHGRRQRVWTKPEKMKNPTTLSVSSVSVTQKLYPVIDLADTLTDTLDLSKCVSVSEESESADTLTHYDTLGVSRSVSATKHTQQKIQPFDTLDTLKHPKLTENFSNATTSSNGQAAVIFQIGDRAQVLVNEHKGKIAMIKKWDAENRCYEVSVDGKSHLYYQEQLQKTTN